MASIYDFTPYNEKTVNNTDFSTNYGFNVISYDPSMSEQKNFWRGLEAYANSHKAEDQREIAQATFGDNLLDIKHAPFWVGEAVTNQLGFNDITQAYIALNIPIPEEAKDRETLSTTLGQNILDNFSKDYDARQAIAADVAKRAKANFEKLINGTYTDKDLSLEHAKELSDYTGYTPHDIYLAGQIIKNNEGKGLSNILGEPTKAVLYSAATIPSRLGEAAAAAFKLDFEQAAKRMLRSSSGFEKNIDEKIQGTAHAYANALAKDAAFLKMAYNPKHVLDIVSQRVYQKEKESLDNTYMLGRILSKISETGGDIYQGLGDMVTYTTAPVVSAISGEYTDTMAGQRASAAVTDAKNAAYADVAKSRGPIMGGLESGANLLIDTAAIANPYTALPSVTTIFTNNAGRGLNALTKNDGELYDTFSPLELYGKSAFSTATTYLSRNVATRYMPKIANRALTKWGIDSTVGHYLGSAAWGTFGFAVTLPAMESVANFAYDEFFVTHPDLKTGVQQAQQFINDLQTPEHWIMSAVAGGTTGAKGTLDYYRSGVVLAEIHQTQGVSKQEADYIRRHTPLEDQPFAYRDLIQTKIKEHPQKWADDLIDGAQKFQQEEQQRVIEKNGYNVMLDEAKQATLKLKGYTITDGKDSDHITILTGGHIDPASGKYIEGTGKIELTKDRAAYFLGAMFDANSAIVTDILRNAYAKDVLQNVIMNNNTLMGKVTLAASLDPFMFNEVVSRGKQAASLIEKRTKELIESSKAEDGKPTLSEADARAQASQETHPDLHSSHTLAQLVAYGKNADIRIQQELERNRNLDPDTTFVSHAWTITPDPSLPKDSLVRIIKITQQATASNLTEEYSEMWLDDYMFLNNVDITDAWRVLDEVNKYIKDSDAKTTTLQSVLAERLRKRETSDDLSKSEMELVQKDVKEGFSFATLSILRQLAESGQLPEWAAPVYNASFLMQHRAQQELATAAAISVAQSVGEYNASLKRLLGVTADQVQTILKEATPPTVESYIETYYKQKATYDALIDGNGKTSDEVMEILASQEQANADAAKLVKDQQDEKTEAFEKEVEEAAKLPENQDKSKEQIALELNQKAIKAKEEAIAKYPAAVDDTSATNGKADETTDKKSKLPCRKATVRIADLHLMPNFKTGSDETTGVVYALVGTYHTDHDPIRILRRMDGSLMVFSGRHRLDHAKKAGMEVIEAYIYDETPEHNLAWARLKDIEWNIKDNQATAEDIALLIRGELIEGIPALTHTQIENLGIIDKTTQKPREKTNAETGYYIGINAISDVVTALKMGDIDTSQAYALALHSPNNEQLQRVGLRAMQDNKSTRLALHEMDVERDFLTYIKDSGVAVQLDFFGSLVMDETYTKFLKDYSFNKLKDLNRLDNARKFANRTAKDPEARKAIQGTGLILDAAAHKRNAKSLKGKQRSIAEQIYIWQHPWTNKNIIGEEIDAAFAKAHPEEWAKMQARINPPAEDTTPDLGNNVQGDVSNIAEFNFSIKAQQGTATVADAEKAKLFKEGKLQTQNALIVEPSVNVDFSVTAYHASPHNFRKFTTDKMGSGEGAQAFGWGLYFAVNEFVNRSYFNYFNKAITKRTAEFDAFFKELQAVDKGFLGVVDPEDNGHLISLIENRINQALTLKSATETSLNAWQQNPRPAEHLKKAIKEELAKRPKGKFARFFFSYAKINQAIADYQKHWSVSTIHGGDTEWAAKNRWNRTEKERVKKVEELSAQQKELAAKIDKLQELKERANTLTMYMVDGIKAINYKVELNVDDSNLLMWNDYISEDFLESLIKNTHFASDRFNKKLLALKQRDSKLTGEYLYYHISDWLYGPKEASNYLLSHGIKGIKYLDGYSRATGKGTYNYVIFDGKDIKITAVNESGKWSMDEGWESYTDPTADFSISSYDTLQAWQLDPTAGLGSLGHFTSNIQQKLAPVGVDFVDQKYAAIQNYIKRRMVEIRNLHDAKDIDILLAELDMLPNMIGNLPAGYRFGLEPYIQFLKTYASLIKDADPKKAPSALPMANWDKKMEGSFRQAFERMLFDELSEMEQSEFDALFDSDKASVAMAEFRDEAFQARSEAREHFLQTHNVSLAEIQLNEDLSRNYKRAQKKALHEVMLKHQDTVDTMYRAIGQMRATRLVDKLLVRVNLKIEQFRKDRTLQKIARAFASITPRTQKDGKPVRGSVSREIYDTAVDNYRLIRLTKSQKEAADELISNLETKAEEEGKELADSTIVHIPTYDEQGAPITLAVTLKQYETYASLESMSADHAAATAQTLGTFIATGKEAWQLRAEQETKAVANFCSPIYDKYQENENEQHIRERSEIVKTGGDKGLREAIVQALSGTQNDASLFDLIASFPGMEQFRKMQDQIATAHEYIEACEYVNAQNAITAALNACGFKDVDPLKLTSKQRKAFASFMEEINTPKKVSITLTPQAPDFQSRITAEMRNSLLTHLNFLTNKKKNFSPNELAAVLQDLKQKNALPPALLKEVFDKYGKIGNADLFKGKLENAYNRILPAQKFGHLRNINNTIKTRTQEQLAKWEKDNNTKPVTLTDLTRNEAAYRILTAEQSDYADLMRRQGYTSQVLQQLKDFAGEDMMTFAYSLRTLLNARTDTLKRIYEATYGTPFPVVENYFRAFFNATNQEKNNTQLEGLSHGSEGKGAGGIKLFKTRIKHNARIRSTMTVTEAFRIGMKEQDNLIAYTDSNNHRHIGEFLSRVLTNRKGQTLMSDVLENAIGSDFHDALKEQVKNMYRIYGQAEGFDSTANRFIRDLGAGAATAILIGRAVSVGKNIMAFFNTLGGADNISPWQWYKSAVRVLTRQAVKKGSDLLNETLIKTRFKEWDTESYVETLYLQSGVKSSLNKATVIAKRGMSIFGAFDRWCTAQSAAVLYDAVYRQLQKENPSLNADALHTDCMMSIGRALGLKGQPLNFKQRPLISTKNSWRTAAFYFLGGEAWSTFMDCGRLFVKSITTKDVTPAQRHQALANFAAVWLTNGAIYGLLNYFFNFLLDDEEHWRKRSFVGTVGLSALTGPISGMPILSDITAEISEQFGRKILGWDMPYISTPSYLPMSNIFQQIGNVKKIFDGKSSFWDKSIAANDAFRAILLIMLTATQRPQSKAGVATKTTALVAAALSNAADFILKLARAGDERLFTPVPEKPQKGVKMSKQSRELNKALRKNNADDLINFTS